MGGIIFGWDEKDTWLDIFDVEKGQLPTPLFFPYFAKIKISIITNLLSLGGRVLVSMPDHGAQSGAGQTSGDGGGGRSMRRRRAPWLLVADGSRLSTAPTL